MTEKELIALAIENDMVIMRGIACLTEEGQMPSITEKLRARSKRLETLMDIEIDGGNIFDKQESAHSAE